MDDAFVHLQKLRGEMHRECRRTGTLLVASACVARESLAARARMHGLCTTALRNLELVRQQRRAMVTELPAK